MNIYIFSQNKFMTILGKRHSESKPSEGLNEILTALMSKTVQQLYTAFGREVNGKRKKRLMDTEMYIELECKFFFSIYNIFWMYGRVYILYHLISFLAVMMAIYKNCTKKELRSLTSRWLSAYGDREGGSAIRKKARIERDPWMKFMFLFKFVMC